MRHFTRNPVCGTKSHDLVDRASCTRYMLWFLTEPHVDELYLDPLSSEGLAPPVSASVIARPVAHRSSTGQRSTSRSVRRLPLYGGVLVTE